MEPTSFLAAAALAAMAGVAMLSLALLRGWTGWIELKRMEVEGAILPPSPAARIELAGLKERVRKLEAIASGVDS